MLERYTFPDFFRLVNVKVYLTFDFPFSCINVGLAVRLVFVPSSYFKVATPVYVVEYSIDSIFSSKFKS